MEFGVNQARTRHALVAQATNHIVSEYKNIQKEKLKHEKTNNKKSSPYKQTRDRFYDLARPGPEGRQGMPPLRAPKVSRAPSPAQIDIYSYIYM
jgi:hypothetical protein